MKAKYNISVAGQHYFVKQDDKLVAAWDLTSSGATAGNPDAIVLAAKVKSAPSPDGPTNVDWVELKKLSGGLANQVYRVDSVSGQPPSVNVSSSLDFVPVLSINVIFFIVHPRQTYSCQVYLELLCVFMI